MTTQGAAAYATQTTFCTPSKVHDKAIEHDASLRWRYRGEGRMSVTGFNDASHPLRANHACIDMVYELEEPGAIAYGWKVTGCDAQGAEIFDRYWYLKDDEGLVGSGADFLGESDEFSMHLIEGLEPGTYTLTLGIFCLGGDGEVVLDLVPQAMQQA